MRQTETRMNAVRLEFTKRKSVIITLCKFISVDLYCKTFNHNMVINSQLFTKCKPMGRNVFKRHQTYNSPPICQPNKYVHFDLV